MTPTPEVWTIRAAEPHDGLPTPPSARSFVLAAVSDGRAVGHAVVRESDGTFQLADLLVVDGWRGRGIGAALVAAAEAGVVARGATGLVLQTAEPGFFTGLGYETRPALPVALRRLAIAGRHAMVKSLAPPVAPWPAVSVLPLRDGDGGLEIFAQHRVGSMDFAAGAVVFPGGRVDPADHETELTAPPHHASAWARTSLPPAATLLAAGIREVAEECGVELAPSDLEPWDNWITPEGGRRRFDVAFFVTAVPRERSAEWGNTTTEAVRAQWEGVARLLDAEEAGLIRMMAPTRALVAELATFTTVAEVLAHSPEISPVLDDEAARPRPPGPAAQAP